MSRLLSLFSSPNKDRQRITCSGFNGCRIQEDNLPTVIRVAEVMHLVSVNLQPIGVRDIRPSCRQIGAAEAEEVILTTIPIIETGFRYGDLPIIPVCVHDQPTLGKVSVNHVGEF